MSHFYLLATGLLTQGSISDGAIANPSTLPPDPPLAQFDAYDTEFLQLVGNHSVPSLELPTLEFSSLLDRPLADGSPIAGLPTSAIALNSQFSPESVVGSRETTALQNSKLSNPILLSDVKFTGSDIIKNSDNLSDFATIKPISGTQLFYQRVAALQSGQIYTRLPAYSFKSYWEKAKKKPAYEQWKRLLVKEAKAIAHGRGENRLAILVGDSLTLWFPQEKLPYGTLWLNQGISGDNSTGILKRLSAFSQTQPDAIYVLAGVNDLKQGATNEAILSNIRQIIRRLRLNHPRSEVVVQSILPTRVSTISNIRIRYLNRQIAAIAQQQGASYLDLHSRFTDLEGNLRADLTTDGVHLTRRGYDLWELALQK
ncbi:hypothetical protein H6F77_24745 [Microcoleus sp. FACHB-831]|uniref:GDSL-type esterase/lipase family protein n=1 Tax=Microcoleus sp. FACHB-831 TaxID=2692827 RepID=UPI001682923A|nr:GDSL-type esterase/lipase family protein [Microcoleus sp. FACHB-831]MBD1924253.1 hypothetical protein [Microcoleus sp. FACHB-831]